ncbi:hypothetical protein NitYY0826_C1170 [Nitratiruptor sp. YY08-26]|nr:MULTISPECIES: hypothetical protein [unclassified Nitratiruptor]BCD62294.1 hypothetical protein NitYY0813_C1168 [Nitratiruptor sp. YY08-13]BCD66230.1 hypothetical protein NitYY0826_C1170 [Nitratiruptor sp. YY08-26]
MKRYFITAAIFGSLLQAQNIDTIVQRALQKKQLFTLHSNTSKKNGYRV